MLTKNLLMVKMVTNGYKMLNWNKAIKLKSSDVQLEEYNTQELMQLYCLS